jgi:hypothetical protein
MLQPKLGNAFRLHNLVLASACVVGLVATSCNTQNPLPGTSLGTYNVTGTLGTNTCGSGLGAPTPWDFTVQLSEDSTTTPTTFYWLSQDGTQLSNTMTSATSVSITSSVTTNPDAVAAGVDAGAATGAMDPGGMMGTATPVPTVGACDLEQNTTLALTLAAGATPASFSGTITYTFETATGVSATSNCTDQLAASGGAYNTLPCTATYTLSATHQ